MYMPVCVCVCMYARVCVCVYMGVCGPRPGCVLYYVYNTHHHNSNKHITFIDAVLININWLIVLKIEISIKYLMFIYVSLGQGNQN